MADEFLKAQKELGKNVRIQGGQATGKMTDLVYDPITGTFKTCPVGNTPATSDMIVTEMTKEGFA